MSILLPTDRLSHSKAVKVDLSRKAGPCHRSYRSILIKSIVLLEVPNIHQMLLNNDQEITNHLVFCCLSQKGRLAHCGAITILDKISSVCWLSLLPKYVVDKGLRDLGTTIV
ncbi:hypothetical protein WAI453_002389 [Rhynchosporium graminicola]